MSIFVLIDQNQLNKGIRYFYSLFTKQIKRMTVIQIFYGKPMLQLWHKSLKGAAGDHPELSKIPSLITDGSNFKATLDNKCSLWQLTNTMKFYYIQCLSNSAGAHQTNIPRAFKHPFGIQRKKGMAFVDTQALNYTTGT
jgi:hypothetical protein